jgi:hypothetical protein
MHVHMQTAERLNPDQIFQFLKLGDTAVHLLQATDLS